VRSANPEDCVTSAAYLLFYRRRSETPLGGNTSKLITEFLAEQEKAVAEDPPEDEPSSSITSSPKINGEDDSSSGSESLVPFGPPFGPANFINTNYSTLSQAVNACSWGGGWSRRQNQGYSSSSPNLSLMDLEPDPPVTTDPEIEVLAIEQTGPAPEDDDVVEVITTNGPEDRDVNPVEGEK
jgi:hypothetical protein